MKQWVKYKNNLFWLAVYGTLFAFLQRYFQYHFYFVEQNQLFQNTWNYIAERLFYPGGFALVSSEFLIQFFLLPYLGAAITAALLTGIGWLTYSMVKRIAPRANLLIACLLPLISLMLIHFDADYLLSGTIAFLLMLLVLFFMLAIKNFTWRLIAHFVATAVLFYLAGPICMLYALSATVYELLNKSARSCLVLFVLLEALLIGVCSVYFSMYGAYQFIFLPDGYYYFDAAPRIAIYFSWVSFLCIIFLACFCRNRQNISQRKRLTEQAVQLVLAIIFCWWGIPRCADRKSALSKELDYYSRTEQWDKILNLCKKQPLLKISHIRYVNIALGQKGELGDSMFAYNQEGVEGILMPWNQSAYASILLSDAYFAMNHIALSQRMAFEGFVCNTNPRMLKRLVQTNLIFGAYPVAEKYLDVLENTICYRDWAKAHRKYLYNDAEIEKDSLLNLKRQSLPKAGNNPSDLTAIEYAGVICLLLKEIENFQTIIETHYGTDILPSLPVSFQEAVCLLSEKNPDYWKRFDISEITVKRFAEFKNQIIAGKNNAALAESIKRSYGDTYWYYYTFK